MYTNTTQYKEITMTEKQPYTSGLRISTETKGIFLTVPTQKN